jgi:hypoxanthine-guanine phosphoribosyltransferase
MAWRRALQIKMNPNDNGCMVISVLKGAVFFFSFSRIEEQSYIEKSILAVEYLNPRIPYFF